MKNTMKFFLIVTGLIMAASASAKTEPIVIKDIPVKKVTLPQGEKPIKLTEHGTDQPPVKMKKSKKKYLIK